MFGNPTGSSMNFDGMVTQQNAGTRVLSELTRVITALFPRTTGTFTCAAAAATTVTEPKVTATSVIFWTPTNAAAGTLESAATKLYLSARTAGASFTVTTASGGAAAGTETFQYAIFNPL